MIAYCGLDCSKCDAFIATDNNDNALREQVVKEWIRAYKIEIKPEDINCTGCRSTGVKVHYCESMCEVKKCAGSRNMETCAQCHDFPCAHLSPVFEQAPQAEVTLRSLRK
jgi:hypothetical protein